MAQHVQEYSHITTQVSAAAEIYKIRFKQMECILAEVFKCAGSKSCKLVCSHFSCLRETNWQVEKRKSIESNKSRCWSCLHIGCFYNNLLFSSIGSKSSCFQFWLHRQVGITVWSRYGHFNGLLHLCHFRCLHVSLVSTTFSVSNSFCGEVKKRWLKTLSFMTLIFILFCALFVLACMFIALPFIYTGKGCIETGRFGKFQFWPCHMHILFQTIVQASMLFLFLYPLFFNLSGRRSAVRVIKIM